MWTLDQIFRNKPLVSKIEAIAASEFVVKVMDPGDSMAKEDDFVTAMEEEIEGLKSRNLWRIDKKRDLGKENTVIERMFIVNLENFGILD